MKVQELFESSFNVYHATSKSSAQDILKNGFKIEKSKEFRLIPNSISFNRSKAWVYDANVMLKANINVADDEIMKISEKKPKEGELDFYSFGKEEDTPLNRGKEIYKIAKEKGFKLIVIRGVVGVGTEYCVLDPSIIKNVVEISF